MIMDYKKAATLALQQICKELDSYIANDSNTGLLGGYTGCALFYAYYYQLTGKEEHLYKIHDVIGKCLQALSEEPMNGSHCSGIAGVSWCIQHLTSLGFIEAGDREEVFSDIDMLVGDFMETELKNGRNDFLHQGLGTALYFLERMPSDNARKQLERMVQHLHASAITLPGGVAWKDHFSGSSQQHQDQDLFNLGLAHGVPAIIAVLARCHEKGITPELVTPLIESSMQWLKGTQNTAGLPGQSMYPVMMNAANKPMGEIHSRLGWCYGDLGIAATLQGTGRRLQKSGYQDDAFRVFHHIATHRNAKNGAVHDACLCHGSAGIAHILQQAGLAANDTQLLGAAREWLEITLKMNAWPDGPAGYKFYHHPHYINSHNILEGIAGIGLSLISFVDTRINPAWGECLLIA